MAAGDITGTISSIGNNLSLTIRPGESGTVWQVKQIAAAGAWELYQTDNTNSIKVMEGMGPMIMDKRELFATYALYFTLKNVNGASAIMSEMHVVVK